MTIRRTGPIKDDAGIGDKTVVWSADKAQQVARNYEAKPTGLADGGLLSVENAGADVKVAAGTGIQINSYNVPFDPVNNERVTWGDLQETKLAGLVTHVSIANSGGGVGVMVQRDRALTPSERRDEIYIGYVILDTVALEPTPVQSPTIINQAAHTLEELLRDVLGPARITEGGEITEEALLTIGRNAGALWFLNSNWHVNKKDPHRSTFLALNPITFRYLTSDEAVIGAPLTTLDPAQYENPLGTVTAVGGGTNNTTLQYLYIDGGGNYWLQWGQTIYSSHADAMDALFADSVGRVFSEYLDQSALFLGWFVSRHGESDWSTGQAEFVPFNNTGGTGGGGGAPAETFDDLTDTPSTKVGAADQLVSVQSPGESSLVYGPATIADVVAAKVHADIVAGNPHNLDAADVGADASGTAAAAVAAHEADAGAHEASQINNDSAAPGAKVKDGLDDHETRVAANTAGLSSHENLLAVHFVIDDADPLSANKAYSASKIEALVGAVGNPPVFHARDEKPNGTAGGSVTGNVWTQRVLNTLKLNEIAGASLGSNQVTLPAGTYEVSMMVPAFRIQRHVARIYNVTDGVTLVGADGKPVQGRQTHGSSSTIHMSSDVIAERFVLAATKVLEVQTWAEINRSTDGLGSFGPPSEGAMAEVYSEIVLRQLA